MSDVAPVRRLLAVNPNRSTGVTAAFVARARKIAPADVRIEGVTGAYGAQIVSIEAENIIASHAALDLLAAHSAGYDAAILAISFDSGLDGAREILPIPVIGITEAMLMAAAAAEGTIGIVVFGSVSLPLYKRLVAKYGLEHRVAGWRVVEIANTAGYLAPQAQDLAVIDAIRGLVDHHAVATAVIMGTAIVGMAERLQPSLPIRILDSAAPAVAAALAAIEGGPAPARRVKPLSSCIGISPQLAALIAGD